MSRLRKNSFYREDRQNMALHWAIPVVAIIIATLFILYPDYRIPVLGLAALALLMKLGASEYPSSLRVAGEEVFAERVQIGSFIILLLCLGAAIVKDSWSLIVTALSATWGAVEASTLFLFSVWPVALGCLSFLGVLWHIKPLIGLYLLFDSYTTTQLSSSLEGRFPKITAQRIIKKASLDHLAQATRKHPKYLYDGYTQRALEMETPLTEVLNTLASAYNVWRSDELIDKMEQIIEDSTYANDSLVQNLIETESGRRAYDPSDSSFSMFLTHYETKLEDYESLNEIRQAYQQACDDRNRRRAIQQVDLKWYLENRIMERINADFLVQMLENVGYANLFNGKLVAAKKSFTYDSDRLENFFTSAAKLYKSSEVDVEIKALVTMMAKLLIEAIQLPVISGSISYLEKLDSNLRDDRFTDPFYELIWENLGVAQEKFERYYYQRKQILPESIPFVFMPQEEPAS